MDSNNNGGTLKVNHDSVAQWEKQRPSFSYATLIKMALENSPSKQLSLQSIYEYLKRSFIYFKENTTKWKSSIRHCLSSNKCFIKIQVEPGKHNGHLWALDSNLDPGSVNSLKLKTTKRQGSRQSKRSHRKAQQKTVTSAVDVVQHETSQNQNLHAQIWPQVQEWQQKQQYEVPRSFVELKSQWDEYNLHGQYNYHNIAATTIPRYKEHDNSSDGYYKYEQLKCQNDTNYVVGTNDVTTTITSGSEIRNTDGGIGIVISDDTNGITNGFIGSSKSSYIGGRKSVDIGEEISGDKSNKINGGSGDDQDQFDYGCLLSDNDCIIAMRIYTAITAV